MVQPPSVPTSRPVQSSAGQDLSPRSDSLAQLADVLAEFARTMLTDFPIQAILDKLVGRMVDVLPVSAAGVTLIGESEAPVHIAGSNAAARRFERLQTTHGEGPCILASRLGEPVAVPDLSKETRFPRFTQDALELGLAAVFTFPLRHGDHQLGALDLYNEIAGPLSADDMSAAQTLADVASAYLINAQARAELQESWDRSRQAALHDPLTGLANRLLMLDRLDNALRRNRRTSKHTAALFIDLDRLKAVNDSYGHSVGDQLLVAAAARLAHLVRPGDTVARMSGDEFAVLCDDLNSPAEAASIGTRLILEMSRAFSLAALRLDITISVGIAFSNSTEQSPEQLLREADAAMYQAKRNGGNQFHVYDSRTQPDAFARLSLEQDLAGALLREELHAEYQPIVAADTRTITGFEALIRWRHPVLGPILPTTIISVAEQTGQISQIGGWMLKQAWSDRLRWRRNSPAVHPDMAVNISPSQLVSANFVDVVRRVLQETGADPAKLTLEITESVLIIDADRGLAVLSRLRELGVKVALDDFGTGYSSLSYLKRLPIDIVKIDRGFVTDLVHDHASRAIVRSTVQLAHELGMIVVAEGVETAQQHALVTDLGCDLCQGFYFGRPMTAAKVDLLTNTAGDAALLPVVPPPRPTPPDFNSTDINSTPPAR